jgi:hypothetical protein
MAVPAAVTAIADHSRGGIVARGARCDEPTQPLFGPRAPTARTIAILVPQEALAKDLEAQPAVGTCQVVARHR